MMGVFFISPFNFVHILLYVCHNRNLPPIMMGVFLYHTLILYIYMYVCHITNKLNTVKEMTTAVLCCIVHISQYTVSYCIVFDTDCTAFELNMISHITVNCGSFSLYWEMPEIQTSDHFQTNEPNKEQVGKSKQMFV